MARLPEFIGVEQELLDLHTSESASYAHGLLCALFCSRQDVTLDEWLFEITDGTLGNADTQPALYELFIATKLQLNDPELGFELLIIDGTELADQISSLKQWSQGFLSGLGLTHIKTDNSDALEVIKIISATASSEGEGVPDTEENRQDFFEITEFIRIGVLFLQDSLHERVVDENKENNQKTLH